MKKVKFIVKDKNTLELAEAAQSGDILDLTEEISVDTTSIEARIAKEMAEAKDKFYENKMEAERKAILANAEKKQYEHELEIERKHQEAVMNYKSRIQALESDIQVSKDSLNTLLANKDQERVSAVQKKEFELEMKRQNAEAELRKQINQLQGELQKAHQEEKLAVTEAEAKKDNAIHELEKQIALHEQNLALELSKVEMTHKEELSKKDTVINKLNLDVQNEVRRKEDELRIQKEFYDKQLSIKDEQIEQYKDFKLRMSTKMVGESLEQHCLQEFNKVRMLAFPKATFGKDNDASSGSKGDFIYREVDDNGVEILSIMFEMKNEMEATAKKHKNEDFFKELDKDRNEKHCEYAVLVSMLEQDSEYYNTGIVNASYEYPKMYVVRPHMFLTLISLLRQAAQDAHQYKVDLKAAQDANVDITNFEGKLNKFKDDFTGHYAKATKNHEDAIKEIDKAIKNLQDVRESLLKSDSYLELCNKDMEKVTIKKLTYGNPTMKKMFEENKNTVEVVDED